MEMQLPSIDFSFQKANIMNILLRRKFSVFRLFDFSASSKCIYSVESNTLHQVKSTHCIKSSQVSLTEIIRTLVLAYR